VNQRNQPNSGANCADRMNVQYLRMNAIRVSGRCAHCLEYAFAFLELADDGMSHHLAEQRFLVREVR
jgi:hypothetical protein